MTAIPGAGVGLGLVLGSAEPDRPASFWACPRVRAGRDVRQVRDGRYGSRGRFWLPAVPEPKRHEHAHGLTITAQLAAMLRARAGPEELAPSRPIPSEPTLMQQYGITGQVGSGTASAAAAWVLAM
jgi:hypothetical protein